MTSHSCPVCGDGPVKATMRERLAIVDGVSGSVDHHTHVCTSCDSEFADAHDALRNKRSVIRFRKGIRAIPLGCEIRQLRQSIGMTQVEAGKFFGGGPVAFSKYETDDLIPSDSMVALLKLAMNDPNVAARLREQHGQHVRVGVGSFEAEGSASDLWFSEMLEANYSTLKNALSASKNLKFEEGASWMIRN